MKCWLASCFLLSACGSAAPTPRADLEVDVAPILWDGEARTWYRPNIDTTWQWQLVGDINTGYDVNLYDIDLFDSSSEIIETLHDAGRTVVCYFSAGSAENFRDDYDRFAAADLGEPLDGWPDERWLDIGSAAVLEIMLDRLDLAVDKGCDGVEPDNVTAFLEDSGFEISSDLQLAYNRRLANEAHDRGLSVALKNDGEQSEALVNYFDFSLNEECHEHGECDDLAVFIENEKPILNAEYPGSETEAIARRDSICAGAESHETRTLLLPVDLDDSFRVACDD